MASPNRKNGSPQRGAGQRPRRASASDSALSSDPLGTPQRFPFPQQPTRGLYPVTSRPNLQPRESAIRLRRLPSNLATRLEPIPSVRQQEQQQIQEAQFAQEQQQQQQLRDNELQANRRRSSSEPHRPSFDAGELLRTRTNVNNMPSVPELTQTNTNTQATNFEPARPPIAGPGRFRRASTAALNGMGLHRNADGTARPVVPADNVYDSRVVDLLDVIGMPMTP